MPALTELVVHDEAIRANTAYFANLSHGRLMAVLKADAFGHGPIAHSVLEAGATSIGVATIAEALALREAGVDAPMLSWLNAVDADLAAAVSADVHLAVASPEMLHAIGRAATRVRRRARVHLHVDIGMAREGSPLADWTALCDLAREWQATGHLAVAGVMGHMSCADRPGDPQNARERLLFANAVRTARRHTRAAPITHLAATAATITGVGEGFDVCRIGAGLFGIDPSATSTALHPTLTLTTAVVGARTVRAGSGIGYGHDYIVDRRTNIALLPLGYGDGLPRAASDRAEVMVRGRRRRLVGRFSMDMVVVDTGDDRMSLGEHVTVFGPGGSGEPTVAEWAGWAGTIEHEIVTRVGIRAPRVLRRVGRDAAFQEVDND